MAIGNVMKGAAKIKKEHSQLYPLLVEALGTERIVDAPGPRSWLGASQVPTWCPRAHVMAYRLKVPMVDARDAQSRWSMDRGTALHRMFQEVWLGPTGYLLGGWKCTKCAYIHGTVANDNDMVSVESAVPLPKKCEKCGQKWRPMDPFGYVEPFATNAQLLVRGRMDGILWLPGHYREVWDLKTTGGELKWVTKAPRLEHVIQLHWYMDAVNIRNGRIVYVQVGAKKFEDAMVEHKVTFDTDLMHTQKERIRGLRKTLEEADRPVPHCPYGGKFPYGDCGCIEMEMLWKRAGRRLSA